MQQKLKKEKLGDHSNSEITKRREILMIPSLTLQQIYHHLSVSIIRVQKGRSFHDFLILTQCNSYIIIDQFQLSKFKTGN